MNRKLIALNVVLAALVLWAGYGLRQMWVDSKARESAGLGHGPGAVPVAPLTPLPNPAAVVPAKYKGIADKDLLSKDRNPDVPVEVPPPPPPPPPMPALPVYHGMMNLGDGPTAFMGKTAGSAYEIVHPGETIGEFKLLSVNDKEIELEWHGQKVRKSVDELTDNTASTTSGSASAASSNGRSVEANAGMGIAVDAPPVSKPVEEGAKGIGEVHEGLDNASCQPGDTTPDGTVQNGYMKTHRQTPFGNICLWIKVGK